MNRLLGDRLAQLLHQPLVEPEVVLGHDHRAEDLAGSDQMMDVGALELRAGRTRATGLDRFLIFRELRIPDVDRAVSGEGLPGPAGPSRQHAVEHVDPAPHGLDNVVRLAHPIR